MGNKNLVINAVLIGCVISLAVVLLASCTTVTTLGLTAQQVRAICQADPETAIAIAERYDGLTDLDGPALVRALCS